MDFIHLWCDDRALSNILCSTSPIPVHALKVKVTDFEFFVLNFYSVSFYKAFDWFEACLVWIDKILKCFIKEKRFPVWRQVLFTIGYLGEVC